MNYKNLGTRATNRVAVPHKYVREAIRGLQSVFGPQYKTFPYSFSHHALDQSLICAAAFQQHCATRWEESNHRTYQHSKEYRLKEKEDTILQSVQTLQHLIKNDNKNNNVNDNIRQEQQKEEKQIIPTFSEKQQARLHSTLHQWVFYCGFRSTRAEFLKRQSKVASILFISPSRVVPSSNSNFNNSISLETSIRRRGARAYIDLLLHHKLNLQEEEEWSILCELCSSTDEPKQKQQSDKGKIPNVMKLPFSYSSIVEVSWERSLFVLSLAMQFKKKNQQKNGTSHHISSVDIANVLQQYVQHFGDRMQIPVEISSDKKEYFNGNVTLNSSDKESIISQLQQWWVEAREAEQKNPKLAEACQLDRTSLGWIHVEGRKVALTPSNSTSSKGDSLFAELLLQGRWKDVLAHIQRVAVANTQHFKLTSEINSKKQLTQNREEEEEEEVEEKEKEEEIASIVDEDSEGRQFSIGTVTLSQITSTEDIISKFFNQSHPFFVKSKLWARPSTSRLGRVPHSFLFANETSTEIELIKCPPTIGLRPHHGNLNIKSKHQKQGEQKIVGESPSNLLFELRRKIWILHQLPQHLPYSLIRFEGMGTSMLPYLLRCPVKELTPWLLLCKIAAIAENNQNKEKLLYLGKNKLSEEEKENNIIKELQQVRLQLLYALFVSVPSYASFQEYCAELVIQLGSLLASPSLIRISVRTIFRPPSLYHFYDVLGGHRVPTEISCCKLWWGSIEEAQYAESKNIFTSCISFTSKLGLEKLHTDSDTLQNFFKNKAASMRNYHVSTWIENCSKVETLKGMLEILIGEVNNYGPPLLSPEAAAALLSAIILPYISENGSETKKTRTTATTTTIMNTLTSLGNIYFVIPADRTFGASPYFKGIYHERYIIPTDIQWTANWDSAEALLVGRSLRQVTKYPTSTTEAFFRVERKRHLPMVTFRVPELRLRLMTLNLFEVLKYFEEEEEEGKQVEGKPLKEVVEEEKIKTEVKITSNHLKSQEIEMQPSIVARHLPFGIVAVNKPAGMSTTLHVGYPHLINFLAKHVPWKGVGAPVLFQNGLVNRIDVGTSGLVLVADTEETLFAARRASVVDRCVEKTYRALLLHCPPPNPRASREECWYLNPQGVITHSVLANGADFSLQLAAHNAHERERLPVAWMDRRQATTVYRILKYFPSSGVYDVEVQLRSGRRHQIRQHFAQLWHPLVGDGRYNEKAKLVGEGLGLHRPALHASRVTILPFECSALKESCNSDADTIEKYNEEKTVVECPLPNDMRHALQLLHEREKKTK